MISLEVLHQHIKDLESRVLDLETIKNPLSFERRLDSLFGQVEDLTAKLVKITQKLKSFDMEKKYVEVFSDDELKSLYEASGLGISDVKEFIEKNITNMAIEQQTAWNYIYGKIKDVTNRSIIGKYLRHYATNSKNS